MTKKPRRSPAKRKGQRTSPARAKVRAKTASKPKSAPSRDPLDDFIGVAARMLALPGEPQWQPAIKLNLQVILRQAALVAEFSLPDDAEPAPVFAA